VKGDIALVRQRQYLVEDVITPEAPSEAIRVDLVCLDDDAQVGASDRGKRTSGAWGDRRVIICEGPAALRKESERGDMRKRLARIEDEIRDEPAELEALYRVSLKRLAPVGLVYLWPTTSI
jgi:hypothetical protein